LAKIVWIVVCAALGAPLVCTPLMCSEQAQPQSPTPQPQGAAPPQPQGAPAAPQPALKPAPPTPIAIEKAQLGDDHAWDPEWDKWIEQALPADLLAPQREREVKSLCPRFRELSDPDKRAFWAYFFQALAGAEAGLKPTADVRHKDPEVAVVDPVTKRIARQEGLLQLAYMDSDRYGCDFDWQKDKELPEHDPAKTILQPKNNLLCGVNILDNQLVAQHKPVLSKSSYWVTLRPGTYSFQHFMRQMANEPEACGAPRIRRRWPWRHGSRPVSEAANPSATQPAASGVSPGVVAAAPSAATAAAH
jgi:hypothetical protein